MKGVGREKRKIEETLRAYAEQFAVNTKGPLSVVLVLTRNAKHKNPPFVAEEFLTPQGGQVAGMGRRAVQTMVGHYGIRRVLAEEGGRTF